MRRSAAAVAGLVGGLLIGAAFIRRQTAQRDRADLYYEDGSMLSLSQGAPEADRLLPLAAEALAATGR